MVLERIPFLEGYSYGRVPFLGGVPIFRRGVILEEVDRSTRDMKITHRMTFFGLPLLAHQSAIRLFR